LDGSVVLEVKVVVVEVMVPKEAIAINSSVGGWFDGRGASEQVVNPT